MIRALTFALLLIAGPAIATAATDYWDLPPTRYSDRSPSDLIAKLAVELESDPKALTGLAPLERLKFILKRLDISEASQILVFSKTSKQKELIHPGNPRAIYFNEHAYVGYVPGGDIEIISHDPILGPIFYLIRNPAAEQQPTITRKTSSCLSCHASARTENTPGMFVRSVFPDQHGHVLLALGGHLTSHASPISQRWGGYYVTGTSSLPHMGNRTYQADHDPRATMPTPSYHTLEGIIDTGNYLQTTSDIVALMILEHQCQMQNLLTSATINHRRYQWLRRSLHPAASPDDPASRDHMRHAAKRIVDAMLFLDEAPLGPDGISGAPAFQEAFSSRFPKSKDGRSLADFQLHKRIFKHPCSYMIYSAAFQALPAPLHHEILSQLKQSLKSNPGPGKHPHIPTSTRRKILSILADTVPGWPQE